MIIRCSRLPLAVICPASQVEPKITILGDDTAARLGNAAHEAMQAIVMGDPVPEDLGDKYGVDGAELDILIACGRKCWEALAGWFPSPETEVSPGFGFSNDGLPLYLTGHVDVLQLENNPQGSPVSAIVADWKSGWQDVDASAQLKGYAWLVCQNYPTVERVGTVMVRLREQEADWAWHTRQQLDYWWERVSLFLQNVDAYNPGRHCRFCPRRLECEAKDRYDATSLRLIEGTPASHHAALYMAAKPGAFYDRLRAVEDICENARELLRAAIGNSEGGSLPTEDGRQLFLKPVEMRSIDYADGEEVLSQYLGPEAMRRVLTVRKTLVEDELGIIAPHYGKGKLIREVMARLEEAGAMRSKTIHRLEVRNVSANNNVSDDSDDDSDPGEGDGIHGVRE